jgi:hypothetical protein
MNELLLTTDANEAVLFEQSLPPGDYLLKLQLAEPLRMTVDELRDYLTQMGIELYSVVLKGNELQIKYHKSEVLGVGQWQMLIPLIVPLVITGAVVFGIFKLGDITNALVPLILIAGGVTILVIMTAGRETVLEAVKRI